MKVFARLVIVMYQTHMGHVDRMDKNVALSRLRLKRCMKRYHRAIFVWYLAVILNNVMVLFAALCCDATKLQKSKEASGVGYKHWFQLELGTVLINHGLHLARELKLRNAAVVVTSFCRLALVKLRFAGRKVVPLCQLQNVRRSVRAPACQLQSVRRHAGRPKKRRRGPLPRLTSNVTPTPRARQVCIICCMYTLQHILTLTILTRHLYRI